MTAITKKMTPEHGAPNNVEFLRVEHCWAFAVAMRSRLLGVRCCLVRGSTRGPRREPEMQKQARW